MVEWTSMNLFFDVAQSFFLRRRNFFSNSMKIYFNLFSIIYSIFFSGDL